MLKNIVAIIAVTLLVVGCKTTEPIELPEQTITIDNPYKTPERAIYNGSETKKFDLVHTSLNVKFNWEKAHLYGKADLVLVPYFYPQKQLVLDARGMDIHKVERIEDLMGDMISELIYHDLKYTYEDSLKLVIDLDKEFTRNDTIIIHIDYTSKPNELEQGGSAAIKSDKGLYFINEKGEDKEKPMQIWTQGETEANSAWFPTIDAPNQKMTQDIAITVADKYKTLSNGVLMSSRENGDGTRTDYWEHKKPHAPYLVMMAIGDYAVVKDTWEGIDVDYYVEHKYEPYAKDIFGLTPEMMTFYSEKLGVKYPWSKYSQVVVRDYVSGAMENTTAVIFGEYAQQTKREMIDGSASEDVIAHELFHHWFGDLVTCESWANLPLNESFATYGEVLWREYKYGDDKAAEGLQNDLKSYLAEVKDGNHKQMVRFGYDNKEDMFDRHSYQKGGRILHMLRNYMGDDAFFTALKFYLEENKYTDVEMHQLRLACEKIIGEDLSWFFNQWFYSKGHPVLDITYDYSDSLKTQTVTVVQLQDFSVSPVFKLPVKIDIYVDGKVQTKKVVIDKVSNEFTFDVSAKPNLVNFDADKMLLCEKTDNHTEEEWVFMFSNAKRYLDRYESLKELSKSKSDAAVSTVIKGLDDSYPKLKRVTINGLKNAVKEKPEEVKTSLLSLAKNDKNSIVRGDAIYALSTHFAKDDAVKEVCVNGASEQSYYVISSALEALSDVSYEDALKFAKTYETEENSDIKYSICKIYADHGNAEHNDYFIKTADEVSVYEKYGVITLYGQYLKKQDNKTITQGVEVLEKTAKNEKVWWVRMIGITSLMDLQDMYKNRIHIAEKELKDIKPGDDKELELRNAIDSDTAVQKQIEVVISDIKETEENPRLKKMLGIK